MKKLSLFPIPFVVIGILFLSCQQTSNPVEVSLAEQSSPASLTKATSGKTPISSPTSNEFFGAQKLSPNFVAKEVPATVTFADHIGETLLDGNIGEWFLNTTDPQRCILGFNHPQAPKLAIDPITRTVQFIDGLPLLSPVTMLPCYHFPFPISHFPFPIGPVVLEDDKWYYLRYSHSIENNFILAIVADSWGACCTEQEPDVFAGAKRNNIIFDEFGATAFIIGGGPGNAGVVPTVERGGILDCGDDQYVGTFWTGLIPAGDSQAELQGTDLNIKFKIDQTSQKVKITHIQWAIGRVPFNF